MKRLSYNSTKKGVASLYVVIFATILFGVITLSFVRIILSEKGQSSNDDLSQSAYDAALAGVEDAKIAVNKYYECKSSGSTTGDCARYTSSSLFDDLGDDGCSDFKLKRLLYPDSDDSEVKIQESTSNNSDQAYTCVLIKNKVDDYRSTLTSDTHTRVVPIGIGSTSLDQVASIEFQWYSSINGTKFSENVNSESPNYHQGKFGTAADATTPPTISLTLLRTDANFSLESFNNSTSGKYSTMVLLPSAGNNDNQAINTIDSESIERSGNSNIENSPFRIKCNHEGEFACTATLNTSKAGFFTAGGNAMLVISIPYGDTVTDFAVKLKDRNGNPINFENVQISVDATGRANQLVRRVETRLDPADIFFPYPEYEVTLNGSNDDSLRKYFWITANCWTESNPMCPNNGDL